MGLNREALRTTAAGAVPAALLAVSALGAAPAAQAAPGGIHETHPDWRPVSADRGKSAPRGPGHHPRGNRLRCERRDRLPVRPARPDGPDPPRRRTSRCSPGAGPRCGSRTPGPLPTGARHRDVAHDAHPDRQERHLRRPPLRRRPARHRQADHPCAVHLARPHARCAVHRGPAAVPTAHGLPAGHRLALVVETVDPLCLEHNPPGAQLTFSSPANDPSHVSVPLREQ